MGYNYKLLIRILPYILGFSTYLIADKLQKHRQRKNAEPKTPKGKPDLKVPFFAMTPSRLGWLVTIISGAVGYLHNELLSASARADLERIMVTTLLEICLKNEGEAFEEFEKLLSKDCILLDEDAVFEQGAKFSGIFLSEKINYEKVFELKNALKFLLTGPKLFPGLNFRFRIVAQILLSILVSVQNCGLPTKMAFGLVIEALNLLKDENAISRKMYNLLLTFLETFRDME